MKNNTLLAILWISSFFAILLIMIPYIINFYNNGISTDPEIWGQFGDYIGGLLNPVLSLINLIVLTYLSIRLVKNEDDRNKWTLQELTRPYGDFVFFNSLEKLTIKFHNYGLGPLIINNIRIIDSSGNEIKSFNEIMERFENETLYNYTILSYTNNHIAIGKEDEVVLFEIVPIKNDNSELKEFLTILKEFTIEISYSDMYKRPISTIKEKMFEASEI